MKTQCVECKIVVNGNQPKDGMNGWMQTRAMEVGGRNE